MKEFSDKVVIVTGGGSGLGREASLMFGNEGANIVVADINIRRASEVADQINTDGGHAIAFEVDVSKESDVAGVAQKAIDTFGRLDIMFANAGVINKSYPKLFIDIDANDWETLVGVNLSGVYYSIKHSARQMRKNGGGVIVVSSSAAGMRAYPNNTIYSTTKGGVNMLVTSAAVDLGPLGIRVNAICPTGPGMSANFFDPANDEKLGKSYEDVMGWDPEKSRWPLRAKRAPNLRDHTALVAFLASDRSAFMSGHCIPSCDVGVMGRMG
jgi:NAD(P)-dependent dehydrogenase (short-subunit alcohol dehydrogenase family)